MTTQVAFLFPGQGSQAVGMGADIYASSKAARHIFAASDEALGFALSDLCFNGPEETLRKTINAQPAIVTVSLATLAAFQEALSADSYSWSAPLRPAFTAGHSVGEWSALVASGVLDLAQSIKLVRERGRLMDHEGNLCPGGMAAIIRMEEKALQDICREISERNAAQHTPDTHPGQGQVVVANYNAPGQIVISGEKDALNQAITVAKERGAKKIIPLVVSGAFHSPVMQPAIAGMAAALQNVDLQETAIPIIGNITATALSQTEALRAELSQQLAAPVQWIRTIEYMVEAGVATFIEIGPGSALTGMVKRIAKEVTTRNISTAAEIEETVAYLREMGI
ncbi:MAG TPA: ACP S-malonyltransferase [Ktedonobacteraceae bacterium]|nr:ACP S-malonyltransferase [Ktedonobacteraceae bacterium]